MSVSVALQVSKSIWSSSPGIYCLCAVETHHSTNHCHIDSVCVPPIRAVFDQFKWLQRRKTIHTRNWSQPTALFLHTSVCLCMQSWICAREQVRWLKLSWRVQPDDWDLGWSDPGRLPPATTSHLHSPKLSRLTPSDLSSLIRSKQEAWRHSDSILIIHDKHSWGNKQRGLT